MDTAQINTSDKMLWSQAHDHVQNLVIKEIVSLENRAKWHEEQHEEEDFSHSEAAKIYRRDAETLRDALFVLARGV